MTTNKLIYSIIKKSFSIIFSLFSLFSYSQKISNEQLFESTKNWVYASYGNPIDGFKRVSIKTNNNYKEDGLFMLSVENNAESIMLKDAAGEGENDRDNLSIDFKSSLSLLELKELLMYFDNDKSYYKINHRIYSENGLLWWNAVDNKDMEFIDRFDFINKLKSKMNVTFRLVFADNTSKEITFSLNGSNIILNQTVDLSNFNNNGDENFEMDSVFGLMRISEINNNDKLKSDLLELSISIDNFNTKLILFLEKKLGKFYSTFIGNIEYENQILYIYDFNDRVILEINITKDLL